MTRLTAILTHESPDLDCTLCVWLLKRFGESRYPGVSQLPVQFYPAGVIPDDLHPDELEATRGILAVDTGGGRLDTHSRDGVVDAEKHDKSAASLVAEDLGIAGMAELEKILQFVTLQEIKGRSIASTQPMDHLVSLPNLIRGLNLLYPQTPDRVIELMLEMYDAAYLTEKEWFQAKEDYKSATSVRLANKARIVAIASDTSAALKVARLHKADLIIHRNSAGQTGITARNNGILSQLNLNLIAEVVRTAEATVAGEPVEYERLRAYGVVHGWFLHDSGRILSKGSPKNREVPPSLLALEDLLQFAGARLDEELKMPETFCALSRSPSASCQGCPFLPLGLACCDVLRGPRERGAAPEKGKK